MKTILRRTATALVAALAFTSTVHASWNPDVRQAVQAALEDARASLAAAGLPKDKTISVLPLRLDQDVYAEGLLKNAVTAAGLTYVEGSKDPFWDEVVREVEWNERKEDMLDAETLTKFGKLKATQLLLYGVVRDASVVGQRVFVELELHLSSVETKQHLWGGVFARRFYLPGTVEGIIDLDVAVRQALRGSIDRLAASVQSSSKLSDVRTVAMVPLAGDIDRYVSGLVKDMLSKTQVNPKDLDVGTLGEARQLLRDQPTQADAVLFGAVRDLSRELERREFRKKTYTITTEVQLTIQSAKTGEVLWSDSAVESVEDVKTQTWWELITENKRNTVIAVAAVIGLLLILRLIAASTRVR